MQMGMGHPQQMASQPGQVAPLPAAQVSNTQPQLAQMNAGPLSIQLSHGGPMTGQSPAVSGAAQTTMPASNANTIFQVTTFRHIQQGH